jgi:hypothetical protein
VSHCFMDNCVRWGKRYSKLLHIQFFESLDGIIFENNTFCKVLKPLLFTPNFSQTITYLAWVRTNFSKCSHLKISASTDGGPRFQVCTRYTLRSGPYQHFFLNTFIVHIPLLYSLVGSQITLFPHPQLYLFSNSPLS